MEKIPFRGERDAPGRGEQCGRECVYRCTCPSRFDVTLMCNFRPRAPPTTTVFALAYKRAHALVISVFLASLSESIGRFRPRLHQFRPFLFFPFFFLPFISHNTLIRSNLGSTHVDIKCFYRRRDGERRGETGRDGERRGETGRDFP